MPLLMLCMTCSLSTGTTDDGKRFVQHRARDQWRGTGILYDPSAWYILRRAAAGKGTWFLIKYLKGSLQLWVGAFHFTPGLTVQKHVEEVSMFLKGRPRDGKPVLLQVTQCTACLGSGGFWSRASWTRGEVHHAESCFLISLRRVVFLSRHRRPLSSRLRPAVPGRQTDEGTRLTWGLPREYFVQLSTYMKGRTWCAAQITNFLSSGFDSGFQGPPATHIQAENVDIRTADH